MDSTQLTILAFGYYAVGVLLLSILLRAEPAAPDRYREWVITTYVVTWPGFLAILAVLIFHKLTVSLVRTIGGVRMPR